MTTTSRPQQRYDHRLRDLVQRTGDLTIATDLGVPRSTRVSFARKPAMNACWRQSRQATRQGHSAGGNSGNPKQTKRVFRRLWQAYELLALREKYSHRV